MEKEESYPLSFLTKLIALSLKIQMTRSNQNEKIFKNY